METVLSRIDGAHARLTLNRPDKRNAINDQVIRDLHARLDELALNPDVRVVSIAGEGACFSAGIDVTYIAGLGGVDENHRGAALRELARKIQAALNRIETLEKPVVAVMHGPALGLAMELALACDFRVGAQNLLFGMPEIHLGLIPDCGGTTRLVRALGVPRAKEFVMLGDRVDAQTAARDGLLTALAGGDDPWTAAGPLIDKLAAMPPRALGLAKRAVDLTASVDEMTGFEIETLVQTGAVTAPDFPQILADGVQKLMAKKT